MRNLIRAAVTGSAVTLLALTTMTSANAGDDLYAYAYADNDVAPKDTWGGQVHFEDQGEHLYIKDLSKDGHSAIAIIEYPGGGREYWWNRNGVNTTRDVNLDIKEGAAVYIRACLGDWSGSPTAGILWATCGSGSQGSA